ncbi:MAG: exosortase, partial [Bacillota bacterium]
MSTVLRERAFPQARARWAAWLAVALGLAVLYFPTYVAFAHGIWRDDAYAHGPIVLAIVAWLVWRDREALLAPADPAPVAGTLLLALGLALEIVGRSQSIALFEGASHLPVIAGLLVLLGGFAAVRRFAFPLLFLLFLVPVPGFILDAITAPLKVLVSGSVEGLLRLMGHDVERSGVVLAIGGHQLLVADACSGLNSIYSLFAMGLLYSHVTQPRGGARIATLLLAVVPIAIVANILRVLALVLVTLSFGEEAAQGFLHGLAGLLVFVAAFALLVGFDRLIWGRTPFSSKMGYVPDFPENGVRPRFWVAVAAAIAMVASAGAAAAIRPAPANVPIDLERAVPTQFAEWRVDPDVVPVAPAPDVQANLARLYQQVVSRTYVGPNCARMMLTIAHGGDQSDALKAHRQEVCYSAQGFDIR